MAKIKAGVLGATGMVGQRFVSLLAGHPWFEVSVVAASARSAGKCYEEAVQGRWSLDTPVPSGVKGLPVYEVQKIADIERQAEIVFSALDLPKGAIQELEASYAAADIPVISNNSAHRFTADVPMIIPEVNPGHLRLIDVQRANRGWKKGLIVVKPNCSLQSYVPVIAALWEFEPVSLFVATMQAISGSGKLLRDCPDIWDNVIPLKGEEEKSEAEPLKILGTLEGKSIQPGSLAITAHCNRVPANDGHMAVVSVKFRTKPPLDVVRERIEKWTPEPQRLQLPSAPQPVLVYVEGEDRPQTRLDRDCQNGMGIAVGRLRDCPVLDYRFMALSHNLVRGAAGGAILTAELLHAKGYY